MKSEFDLKKIKDYWESKFDEKKRIKFLVFLGVIGIILICLPEFFSTEKGSELQSNSQNQPISYHDYSQTLAKGLEEVLGKIEGVGEIKVLVTLKQEEEYIFAVDNTSNDQQQEQSKQNQTTQTHVIVEQNGQEEPLITTKLTPLVQGVIVVCSGGDDPVVVQELTQAVTAVLNISSNHISVSKLG